MGFGEARGDSTYTGYVVDVEKDKGILFRTNQVHLKTHQRSSANEEFCVPPENADQLEEIEGFLSDDTQVEVEYHRPLWVSPFDCEPALSIADSITASGSSGQ